MKKAHIGIFLISIFLSGCMTRPASEVQAHLVERNKLQSSILTGRLSRIETSDISVHANEVKGITGNEFEPVLHYPPLYPREAVIKGIEGWSKVSFTVNTQGDPIDIEVIDHSGTELFNKAAIDAVKLFLYQPLIHKGKLVSVSNIELTFKFILTEQSYL